MRVPIMGILLLLLGGSLGPSQAMAQVYRCVGTDGKIRFQDDICQPGEAEQKLEPGNRRKSLKMKQALASQSLPPGAAGRVSRDGLLGVWCAYGLSNDGEHIYHDEDPGVWNFRDYKQMSYTVSSAFRQGQEMFSEYHLDGVSIQSKNKLVGDWEVVSFNGSTMTLANGVGFQYLRKGMCF